MPKKTGRGNLWDFSTSILSQNIKNLKGDPLGIFLEKKSHNAEKKTEKGDSLVSPGMACYAEKGKKTLLVQFARPNDSIWDHKIL